MANNKNTPIIGSAEYFEAPSKNEVKSEPNQSDTNQSEQSVRCQLIDKETNKRLHDSTNKDFIAPLIQDISQEPFFHGCVAVEDTAECLAEDGDFLLRTPYDSVENRSADKAGHSLVSF